MIDPREKLFTDFKPSSKQEWLDKITIDLKGADFNKKLVWHTQEGFNLQPFYMLSDIDEMPSTRPLPGQYPFVRGNNTIANHWYIRQNLICDDANKAHTEIAELLTKGVDSFGLHIPYEKLSQEFVEKLLQDLPLDKIELNLSTCQRHMGKLALLLSSYLNVADIKHEIIHGSLDFDPIAKMLLKGTDKSFLLPGALEMAKALSDFPHISCLTISSLLLKNAGCYCYQEMGYALAWGNEYMNLLTEGGIPATQAANKIRFSMGIGSNYFMEIGKFRAFRMLWAKILNRYGVPEEECKGYILATTTEYNQTLFDPYVNLLRSETETMSAALAGVDAIAVTPFDKAFETPTEFAERIARNQQLLLKEEAHFDKVVDAAAGSYYLEELTQSLQTEAWKLFLNVEEEGGFLTVVQKGSIQKEINKTNLSRHERAAQRKEFILGTNQFPNFNETSGKNIPQNKKEKQHDDLSAQTPLPRLDTRRLASEFETLRLQTEQSGKRPKAFMLTIGDLKWRQARAQFSCNFLACAGYEVIDNLGFDHVEEGITAAIKQDADIVVLCSSDDEYAAYALPAFKALNGKAIFIVAGAPACSEELKEAGIENFIHIHTNQLEMLKQLNKELLTL